MVNKPSNKLEPLIKYPGGKEKELKYILPSLPKRIENYYEPFVGGGAVYFAMSANKYFINDKSHELISLYNMVKEQNKDFFEKLNAIEHNWGIISDIVDHHKNELMKYYNQYASNSINKDKLRDLISSFVISNSDEFNGLLNPDFNYEIESFFNELCKSIVNKMNRMKKISLEKGKLSDEDTLANIEASFKAAFYTHFRRLMNYKDELGINNEFATAIYFFIRQTCYSSMFRYNKNGKFNVPYGGISYNRKSFANKIKYYSNKDLVEHLNSTTIGNMDFYDFMNEYKPKKDDFIFLDPPYDTEFSTYAQNEFDKDDQSRLADYLINETKGNFMIVIKNTDYISSLYKEDTPTANGGKLVVNSFDKNYFVSFKNRNNKEAEHLLITNYEI